MAIEGRRSCSPRSATASWRSKHVLSKLVPQEQLKEAPDDRRDRAGRVVRRVLGAGEEKIKVRGFDDLMVFRARCCNPIRGEKIVGYITRGKGVSVHSAACPNVVNLLYDPSAGSTSSGTRAPTCCPTPCGSASRSRIARDPRRRQLEDRRHQHQHPERRGDLDDDQMGRIDMTVEISDVKHLQKVIKSLRSVEACGRGASRTRRRTPYARRGCQATSTPRCGQSQDGDDVDLDARVLWQPRHLHGRARRGGRREVGRVDLVHRGEVVHVGQIHRRADDLVEGGAGGLRESRRCSRRRGASGPRCRRRRRAGRRDRAESVPRRTAGRPGRDGLRYGTDGLGRRPGLETA